MAGGAKLATGWLELTVSTAGAQKSIVSEMGAAGAPAGESLGRSLLGTIGKFAAPIAAAFGIGKAIATGFDEVKDAAAVTAQLSAGIASTGSAANVSVDGLNKLASSIQATTGQTDDSIGAAQGLLLTFTNIKNIGADRIFDQATVAAADMAARMGGDAASKAQMLGKALNDPVQGIAALTRVGVQFTQQQKDQISTMVEAGDTLGAQKVILAELNTQFGGSAAAFGQTLPGQLARAKRAFEDFTQTAVGAITPLAGPVLELLIGGLGKVTDAITPVANKIAELGPVISGLFSLVVKGDITGGLLRGLGLQEDSPLIDRILDVRDRFVATFSGIASALAPVFAQLGPILGQLAPSLIELWSSLSPVSLIFGALAPVLPQIVSLFGSLAVTLGGVLSGAIAQLLPVATNLAGALVGLLGQAVGALLPVITAIIPIVGQIAQALGGALGAVITAIIPIVTMFAQLLARLVPIVLPLITAVLGLVAPILSLIAPLLQLVGPILQPLIGLFIAILQPILALIPPLVQALVPALQLVVGVLTTVISWVASAIEWFVKWITGNQEAGDQFQAVWGAVMGFFAGIGQFFANVWNGLISGVSNMVGSVVGFFTSLPGQIGSVFAGAGQWLVDAGVNIVNGLIDGIRSMAGSIGKWFLSIVPDWIKAPFMAALGIQSPSRVFKQYGVYTMQGFIDGVTSMEGRVQDAADAAGQLTPPGNARAGTGGSQSGSSVQVSAPVNIRMYDRDPRIVGAQIGRGIEGALHG